MKKNLMTVIILALLVVNIVLTSVLMFSVIGTNKKTAELVTNIATVLDLELTVPGQEEPERVVSLEDTEIYSFASPLTIPLAPEEGEKQKYIMFEVALSMDSKHKDYKKYSKTVDEKSVLIQDTITSVVSAYTESECRADLENNLEGLKKEILTAIQKLFDSDFIYKVAINEVKFG